MAREFESTHSTKKSSFTLTKYEEGRGEEWRWGGREQLESTSQITNCTLDLVEKIEYIQTLLGLGLGDLTLSFIALYKVCAMHIWSCDGAMHTWSFDVEHELSTPSLKISIMK